MTRAACDWLRAVGTPATNPGDRIEELGFGLAPIFEEWERELRADPSQVFVSELGCAGMADLDEVVAAFGERLDLLDAREIVAFRDDLREGFATHGINRCFASVRDLADRDPGAGGRRQSPPDRGRADQPARLGLHPDRAQRRRQRVPRRYPRSLAAAKGRPTTTSRASIATACSCSTASVPSLPAETRRSSG